MPNIQVKGDPNTGGGIIETPPQDFYHASGILISIDNTSVTPHPPDHTNVKTTNGSNFFRINGTPINLFGRADTCGHTRAGTIVPWFDIQS